MVSSACLLNKYKYKIAALRSRVCSIPRAYNRGIRPRKVRKGLNRNVKAGERLIKRNTKAEWSERKSGKSSMCECPVAEVSILRARY